MSRGKQILVAQNGKLKKQSNDKSSIIMNDKELVKEFIKVEQTQDKIIFLVCKVYWQGPHTPIAKWVKVSQLKKNSSQYMIDKKIRSILNNEKYFRVCKECSNRNIVGHMHNDNICQECAERNHGVVY
jgi:hypothetical protein